MITPLVSVIITAYNAEKFIQEAIDSIINQTYSNWELILINDFSSDRTGAFFTEIKKQDSRVKIITNSENLGRAKSRNRGLELAKGEYIAILDADDVSLTDRLEKQVTFLEKNTSIFLVGTGATKINEDGKVIGYHNPICSDIEVKKTLSMRNCIYHSSVMFRKTSVRYREKFPFSQDYDFYLQLLAENKNLTNIPEKLLKYRIVEQAASWSNSAKQRMFAQKAKEFYQESKLTGKSGYNQFDPEKILNLDLTNSNERLVLETEIEALFKLSKFREMRKVCWKLFWLFGVNNIFFVMYLLSFGGKRIVNLVRKSIKKVY
jgi:glycosyltransferase involved in cell wall biosynthesis